jgi:mono/diheme cytochrome c family protein
MKRALVAGLAALLAGWMSATIAGQDEEGPSGARVPVPTRVTTVKASRTPIKTVKVEVPVDKAARNDTPAFKGEGWFQQNCGVCHLGRWRKQGQLQSFAPVLSGVLKDRSPEREAAVREYIRGGSANMPGFQNAFTPAEFDELIAYLKTL